MQNLAALPATNVMIERGFLTRLIPNRCYSDWVTKRTLAAHNSGTLELARIERIAPLTGATPATVKSMVDGTTPADTAIVLTKIQIATAQFGHLVRLTDQVDLLNERQVLSETIKLNAENLTDLEEAIIRDGLLGGTAVHRYKDSVGDVSGAAFTNVLGLFNPTALDKAVRVFESGNVPKFTKGIAAGSGEGTVPIDACWICITHPDAATDLRRMPGFIRVEEYASQGERVKGEIGTYNLIRFVGTTNCRIRPDVGAAVAGTKSTTGVLSDVYQSIFLGDGAACSVDGAAAKKICFVSHDNLDHAEPLGLTDAMGYKLRAGAGIQEDARILRIEHAVSA